MLRQLRCFVRRKNPILPLNLRTGILLPSLTMTLIWVVSSHDNRSHSLWRFAPMCWYLNTRLSETFQGIKVSIQAKDSKDGFTAIAMSRQRNTEWNSAAGLSSQVWTQTKCLSEIDHKWLVLWSANIGTNWQRNWIINPANILCKVLLQNFPPILMPNTPIRQICQINSSFTHRHHRLEDLLALLAHPYGMASVASVPSPRPWFAWLPSSESDSTATASPLPLPSWWFSWPVQSETARNICTYHI